MDDETKLESLLDTFANCPPQNSGNRCKTCARPDADAIAYAVKRYREKVEAGDTMPPLVFYQKIVVALFPGFTEADPRAFRRHCANCLGVTL